MQEYRFLIFLLSITLIFVLIDIYFLSKIKDIVKQRNWNKYVYFSFVLIAIFSLISWLLVLFNRQSNFISLQQSNELMKFVTIWYFPKLVLILFFIPIDISKQIKSIYSKLRKKPQEIQLTLNSRRKFIQNTSLCLAAIPFGIAIKGVFWTALNTKVYFQNIYLNKLPYNLNNLKIIQISDLHLGSFSNQNVINEMCFKINNLNPDLVFITGDFVNNSPKELDYGLSRIGQISSKHGIYACLGNHDHYMTDHEHSDLINQIKSTPIRLLINENTSININNENINIVGVDNEGLGQSFANWEKAFEGVNSLNPTFLLCHDPNNWEKNILNKYPADITFAGHTHGGQIGFHILNLKLDVAKISYKYYAGLYTNKDQFLYVNRGIGTTGPSMRVGMDPEITCLNLKVFDNLT